MRDFLLRWLPGHGTPASVTWPMTKLGKALQGIFGYELPTEAYVAATRLDAKRLTVLDSILRAMWDGSIGHNRTDARAAVASLSKAENVPLALFVAGCDGNGFMREAALQAMPADAGTAALSLALLRADDRVPQVRAAALTLLAEIFKSEDARFIFERLDLVFALRARQRFGEGAWQAVETKLLDFRGAGDRWNAARNPSHVIRRFAWDLMARADADVIDTRLLDAVHDPHPAIAHWALERARTVAAWRDVADAAARHPQASVRAESLRLRMLRDGDAAIPDIEPALFDRAQTVRLAASFLLRGKVDAIARWRTAADANDEPARAIGIAALADLALPDDRERFRRATSHPRGSVRAHALVALARVDRDEVGSRLLNAFADPSPRVARTAFRLARKVGLHVEPSTIDACFARADGPARARVVANADLAGKWESVALLLSWLAQGPSPSIQHALRERVAALNQGHAPLTAEMRARIARTLDGKALPEPVRREVEFALRTSAS